MFERFEPDSKRAIYFGLQIANHRGQKTVSPEDLLIGLTWRNHDHDCQFGQLKSDAGLLWAGVGVTHLPLSARPYSTLGRPLDRRSRKVLRFMRAAANSQRMYWMDIDHMLLGILLEGGPAAKSLRDAGWTEERICSAAAYGRARYPQKPVPRFAQARIAWSRYGRWLALTTVVLTVIAAILYLRYQN